MKAQCIICGECFDEDVMIGEYCPDCYMTAAEEE
jgi:hypothetical protein